MILCPTGAPPKVYVNTTVEYMHTVHHLRPETHLRPEQGEEFQAKMTQLAQMHSAHHPVSNKWTKDELFQILEVPGGGLAQAPSLHPSMKLPRELQRRAHMSQKKV